MRPKSPIEEKARLLEGRSVRVTCLRHPHTVVSERPAPYHFECTIDAVRDGYLVIRRGSGMSRNVPISDQYMAIVDISEAPEKN
jgi:hypothetical protein